ncbi:MAG TPA: L-idonate 5-dehydrogenase [Casimicrobiaceae bacterium]
MLACRIHAKEDLRIEAQEPPVPATGEVLLALGAGGICGSDLHYFHDGRNGSFVVREPLVPGHEASAVVVATGPGVTRVKAGDKVAVSPSHACGRCGHCRQGREQLCDDMRFLGSASVFPHAQGLFREQFVMHERQCFPVQGDISLGELAFAEPLAVALHAINRGGDLLGKSVLIAGAGTIGCLIVLAARLAGAARIAVSDILDRPLSQAAKVGADEVLHAARDADALSRPRFDITYEASGSIKSLATCVAATKRGGTIVQVGTLAHEPLPFMMSDVMTKELNVRGAFRWGIEFDWAVSYLSSRRVDVRPLLSGQYPLTDAIEAFRAAADKNRSTKVQLVA